jgi:hypothetical protein
VTRILWFSIRFLLLYALLQAVFTWTPVGSVANRLVASAAARTLSICLDRTVLWTVKGNDIQIKVPVQVEGALKAAVANLKNGWYTRNLPMFLAIVLAAARGFRRRLLAILGFGLLAVILLDGLVGAAHAWNTVSELVPLTTAYHVLSVFGVWSLGGMFAAPVFVGALLAFTLLGDPVKDQGGRTPGRNDPCPCASGRKYKRCCGAERAPASG